MLHPKKTAATERALRTSHRLLPVDALRGTAMTFVGISHISLFVGAYSGSMAAVLKWLGFFATPNFLLMSGLACGYQLARVPGVATVARIVDRGLFVLLIGHVLIAGSLVYITPPGTAFQQVMITDTIGLLLCLTPLFRHLGPSAAVATGLAIFVCSSVFGLAWHPVSPAGIALGGALLDVRAAVPTQKAWVAPTVQYFGIFIVGLGIGKLICRHRGTERERSLSQRLLWCGAGAMLAGVALNGIAHVVRPVLLHHFADAGWVEVLLEALNVRRKNPPGLAYALFYGGAGIALVGALGLLTRRDTSVYTRAARIVAVVGRASFVSYVAQQWLIDFVPMWLNFQTWLTPRVSIAYLVLVVLATLAIAEVWDRYNGNRHLTLGLKWVFAAPARPARQQPDSLIPRVT